MPDPLRLRFHASLYGEAAVRRAAERFAPLAESIVVEAQDADVLVTLLGVAPHHRERLTDELQNHALVETVREGAA